MQPSPAGCLSNSLKENESVTYKFLYIKQRISNGTRQRLVHDFKTKKLVDSVYLKTDETT